MEKGSVEVRNLEFVYPDGHKALNGLSFRINPGESVGIVGANGAGKSTLLLLLMGILTPQKGEILVDEVRVEKKTLSVIRKKMGLVFQDPDDQLFMTTVYHDVAFGPRNEKLDEEEVERRVLQALETMGILHLKDRAPFKLSGGEKRAAAIAAILAMQPGILIMDEPSAALDPKSRRRVIELLKGLTPTRIVTSHDLDMILDLCERTIIIQEGKIIKDGKTSEILTDEKLLDQCGLELPLSVQPCPVCGR